MNEDVYNTDTEYLGISEAAEYLRVSASTLRRWEKKGFLIPERTPTGIRRYTKNHLDMVMQTPYGEPPKSATTAHSEIPFTATREEVKQSSQTSTNTNDVVRIEKTEESHIEVQKSINSVLENLEPVTEQQVDDLNSYAHFGTVLDQHKISEESSPENNSDNLNEANYSSTSNEEDEDVEIDQSKTLPLQHIPTKNIEQPIPSVHVNPPTKDPYSIKYENQPIDPFAELAKEFGVPKDTHSFPNNYKMSNFDDMFHVEHTATSDDEYEPADLDEYDQDAAQVYPSASESTTYNNGRSATYKFAEKVKDSPKYDQPETKKSFPTKRVVSSVIAIVLLLFLVVILMFFVSNSQTTPLSPMNPVIE